MANRFGNNYRVAIGTETALGSGKTNSTSIAWTEVLTLPDTIELVADIAAIETGAKTQTGLATLCEAKRGYQNYTVTVSGVLSNEHEILLTAMGLTESPTNTYTMDKLPTTIPSYVIMRVWSDAPTGTPTADKYKVDKASGCQLMRLVINGSSGDMVRYEATFMAQTYAREATQEITGTDPGTVCTEGFNFGDVTGTFAFGDQDHLKTFSLTLEHEIADDASSFQNSNTRLATIPVKVGGELTYTTNYDTAGNYDKIAESLLHYNIGAITDEIKLENTTMTWTIDTTGQLTTYTLADPDRQMFENNTTQRLVTDGETYPVKIVVAALTP
jgi:hypothetical protein